MTTKIVALCGSLRAGSNTRKALGIAVEGAEKAGGEVTVVDLAEWHLPPFDGDTSMRSPEATRFQGLLQAADGLLLATPVYHDSCSGMLKNALDLLRDELEEKIAGLLCVGGGTVGQGNALGHLRTVLREMGTWVIPRQVILGGARHAFDDNDRPKDRDIEARLLALGQELVLRCRTMRGGS